MIELWTPQETLDYVLELEKTLASTQDPVRILWAAEDATRRMSEDARRELAGVLKLDATLESVREEVLRAFRQHLETERPQLELEIEQERQDDLRRLGEYYQELQGRVSARRLSEIAPG